MDGTLEDIELARVAVLDRQNDSLGGLGAGEDRINENAPLFGRHFRIGRLRDTRPLPCDGLSIAHQPLLLILATGKISRPGMTRSPSFPWIIRLTWAVTT